MAWDDRENDAVVKALAIVCEVTSTQLSDAAKKFIVRELSAHPSGRVLAALRRCARECTRRLALADVLERVEEERERDTSRLAAADTRLRIDALTAGIPWELGKAEVARQLAMIGNGRLLPGVPKGEEGVEALRAARKRFDPRAAAAGEEQSDET